MRAYYWPHKPRCQAQAKHGHPCRLFAVYGGLCVWHGPFRKPGHKPFPITAEDAIAAVKQHGSLRAAAKAFGCSPALVSKRLRAKGLRVWDVLTAQ